MGPTTRARQLPRRSRQHRLPHDRAATPPAYQPDLRRRAGREDHREFEEQPGRLRRSPTERSHSPSREGRDGSPGCQERRRSRREPRRRSPQSGLRRCRRGRVPTRAHRALLRVPPRAVSFPRRSHLRPVLLGSHRGPHATHAPRTPDRRRHHHGRAVRHHQGQRRWQSPLHGQPRPPSRAHSAQPGECRVRGTAAGEGRELAGMDDPRARLPRSQWLLVQAGGRRRRDPRIQGHRALAAPHLGLRDHLRIPRLHSLEARDVEGCEPPRDPRHEGHHHRQNEPHRERRQARLRSANPRRPSR